MKYLAVLLVAISVALQPLLASERASCAMSGTAMAAHDAAAGKHHDAGGPMPCQQPADDGSCQLMASCSQAFAIGTPAARQVDAPAPSHPGSATIDAPPFRSDPPELPPPRA
ncbi:MAG TPA: hypothetical protein VHM67_12890 [Gemmatimonadaceae bacterium]|nr:hypothetical protein [Gemmatimonadaceae bacterium]